MEVTYHSKKMQMYLVIRTSQIASVCLGLVSLCAWLCGCGCVWSVILIIFPSGQDPPAEAWEEGAYGGHGQRSAPATYGGRQHEDLPV